MLLFSIIVFMVNELLSSDIDKANAAESLIWVGVVESDSKGHRK